VNTFCTPSESFSIRLDIRSCGFSPRMPISRPGGPPRGDSSQGKRKLGPSARCHGVEKELTQVTSPSRSDRFQSIETCLTIRQLFGGPLNSHSWFQAIFHRKAAQIAATALDAGILVGEA
jgi:hypothetical protein